jgi:hypothetical protein
MSPEGQSVLEQAQSTVVDAFKSLLGIEEGTEESAKVDKKIVDAGKVNVDTPDADVEKLAKVSEEETQQIYESTLAQIQRSASLEDSSVDRSGAKTGFTPRVGLTPRDVETDIDFTKTVPDKYLPTFQNLTGIETVPRLDRKDLQTVGAVPKAEQVTGGVGEIKTRRDDIRAYIESIKDPETAADAFNNVTNVIDQ